MWHSHPTVQGQWKQNKDKHDAATLLTGLANFPHHLAPILTLLLLFFGLLMFIPALIIISSLFFHFSPPPPFYIHYILHLYHLILIALTNPQYSYPVCLCLPPFSLSVPCECKVPNATHCGMAVNKRAKQKVNISRLSLNAHHTASCLLQESGTTHWSSCHWLHIIFHCLQKLNAPLISYFCEYLIIRSLTVNSN